MPTVKLSPVFNGQTETSTGAPASSYKLYTYAAGSSTLQATYTDSTGSTAQANPIVLNSLGFADNPIWLQSGLSYKFVLTDAAGVTLKTIDNVSGINDTTTSVSQWQSSGLTPTYVSASSFTLSGDQTTEFHVGRRLQFTVTAGTVYGTIKTTAYTTLTTVTMDMDSGSLDSGLSVVNLSLLRADLSALPKRNYVANDISATSFNGGQLAGLRNKIINGKFDIWQRGTSLAAAVQTNAFIADRWAENSVGSTIAASQQAFTLGQTDVPGEPTYFHRSVVASTDGAANYAVLQQRIEGVRTFAGQTVTVSFYAKADVARPIAIDLNQNFGTGGTPSANVSAIGAQKFNLTTAWQKFTATITVPSIAGKTLGTNNNDFLELTFWFDAGTNFASRSATLGQQSGTFDISLVQIENGSVATPFEHRLYGQELALCQRFYETGFIKNYNYAGGASQVVGGQVFYKVLKRATPSIVLTNIYAGNVAATPNLDTTDATSFAVYHNSSAAGSTNFQDNFTSSAEL